MREKLKLIKAILCGKPVIYNIKLRDNKLYISDNEGLHLYNSYFYNCQDFVVVSLNKSPAKIEIRDVLMEG